MEHENGAGADRQAGAEAVTTDPHSVQDLQTQDINKTKMETEEMCLSPAEVDVFYKQLNNFEDSFGDSAANPQDKHTKLKAKVKAQPKPPAQPPPPPPRPRERQRRQQRVSAEKPRNRMLRRSRSSRRTTRSPSFNMELEYYESGVTRRVASNLGGEDGVVRYFEAGVQVNLTPENSLAAAAAQSQEPADAAAVPEEIAAQSQQPAAAEPKKAAAQPQEPADAASAQSLEQEEASAQCQECQSEIDFG